MRIFFCSALGATYKMGWQRCQVLKELGEEVIEFSEDIYFADKYSSLYRKLKRKLLDMPFEPRIVEKFNQDFLIAIKAANPQVAWIEKALMLLPETLNAAKAALPSCLFVSWQNDNPFGKRPEEKSLWKYFIQTIPLYDLHCLKRTSDLLEFQKRGALQVQLAKHYGFYPPLFHPVDSSQVPQQYRCSTVFVGSPLNHFIDQRVKLIRELTNRHSIPITVYGNAWNKTPIYWQRRTLFKPAVVGLNYVYVISGSKICLGLVSGSNLDEYTIRTFEIPACQGFLLAQRTPTHLDLFQEGKEAEFFDSVEECADKINFYLKHESARAAIARAGYERCLSSDYSLHARLKHSLERIQTLLK